VSRTVFSKEIGFQLNTANVLLTSASIVFPINGNIPFISLLKLAINFNKKVGANLVLTLSYPFDFKICPISCIAYGFCDISKAIFGPKGLIVSVVCNAENITFRGIEADIKRLAIKARDGQITVDDMTGGTFTITNGGVFESMLSTPIINPPQSGILGMHNIIERPIAVNGKVEIHPMMYVALSYDHRIIDGRESVGFLVAVKEALENPLELLCDNNPKKAFEL